MHNRCMTYQSPTEKGTSPAGFSNAVAVFENTGGALRTVLVCDVVDSVRWMQLNETAAIAQWQTFIHAVKQRVLPKLGGRLVKSLGDGLMLEFVDTPQNALAAAFAMKEIATDIRLADSNKQANWVALLFLNSTCCS